MSKRSHYVYIVANGFGLTHVGVTNDLERRVEEHRRKPINGLTKQYNLTSLVYFERYGAIGEALAREKQLKRMHRSRRIGLIESLNPMWDDLSDPSMPPAQ